MIRDCDHIGKKGGAFFDFDDDGDPDLVCINSCSWPWDKHEVDSVATSRLYENDGNGYFADITSGSGLDVPDIYGNGVACGDFDNDGWQVQIKDSPAKWQILKSGIVISVNTKPLKLVQTAAEN